MARQVYTLREGQTLELDAGATLIVKACGIGHVAVFVETPDPEAGGAGDRERDWCDHELGGEG